MSLGFTASHGHSGPMGQGPRWMAHVGGLWWPMPPGSRPEHAPHAVRSQRVQRGAVLTGASTTQRRQGLCLIHPRWSLYAVRQQT
jgi:hypothetical protein